MKQNILEAENKFHKFWQMMKKDTAALKTNYVIEVSENSNVQPFVC